MYLPSLASGKADGSPKKDVQSHPMRLEPGSPLAATGPLSGEERARAQRGTRETGSDGAILAIAFPAPSGAGAVGTLEVWSGLASTLLAGGRACTAPMSACHWTPVRSRYTARGVLPGPTGIVGDVPRRVSLLRFRLWPSLAFFST